MDLKARAKKLKQDIPVVFLSLKDKETPLLAKLFALLTVTYALSPIDLIPDFIPVLGYVDDIILLPIFIAIAIKLIPDEIWEKNKLVAANYKLESKWYYAITVIIIWILVICLIVSIFT